MRALRGLGVVALLLPGCGVKSCVARQCEESPKCTQAGQCSVRFAKTGDGPWRCYAGSDADCEGSQGCKEQGKCFATQTGICVVEGEVEGQRCEHAEVCAVRGDCAPSGEGFCVAVDDASCRASKICADAGQCSYVEGGGVLHGLPRCAVTDAADCEQSSGCAARGDCGVWEGAGTKFCAPTTQAHCEASSGCAEGDACTLVPGRTLRQGRCAFIPTTNEDCVRSPGCRLEGTCAMVDGYASSDPALCEPTEQAHCDRSEACTKDGKCKYWPRPGRTGESAPGGSCGW